MKYRYGIIIYAVAILLQGSILNNITILGAAPNLLLCLTIVTAFLYENGFAGIVLGAASGLLYDICFTQYAGVTSLAMFVVGILVMLSAELMNKEKLSAVIIVTVIGTFLYDLLYWCIRALLGSPYSFMYMLKLQPQYICYNIPIAIILYFIVIGKVIKYRQDRFYR